MENQNDFPDKEEKPLPTGSSVPKFHAQFDGQAWQRRQDPHDGKEDVKDKDFAKEHKASDSNIAAARKSTTNNDGDDDSSQFSEDSNFELDIDDMIHQDDDETTIALDDDDDENELADLTEEANIPLDEFREQYEAAMKAMEEESNNDDEDDDLVEDCPANLRSGRSRLINNSLMRSYDSSHHNHDDSDTSDSRQNGEDFGENKTTKASARVGQEFQADYLPECGTREEIDHMEHDTRSTLCWTPQVLTEKEVVSYLQEVWKFSNPRMKRLKKGRMHDNEIALKLLQQAGHRKDKALSEFKSRPNPCPYLETWTDGECDKFERGLNDKSKDFYQIHAEYVHTKSVKEIIQFYYIWKKSKRHEEWRYKNNKKREGVTPGHCDYMERLLDETDFAESNGPEPMFYNHTHALERHMTKLNEDSFATGFLDNDYRGHEFLRRCENNHDNSANDQQSKHHNGESRSKLSRFETNGS